MSGRPGDHLSDAELSAMSRDLDDLHRDQTLPALQAAVAEWTESIRTSGAGGEARRTNRRTFLLGLAGLGGGGIVLAACGSSNRSRSSSTTAMTPATTAAPTPTTAGGRLTGDLALAATAASLENLAVFAYNAGLQAATQGKLGKVPPAVATFARTAMAQHKDHAQAWNAALSAAGKPPVTATDPALTPTVQAAFAKVTNVTGLAELALTLENGAAQTYQNGVALLSSARSIAVAATIQPVEMQHAAILYYALGRYPGVQGTAANSYTTGTPLAFNPTTLARPATDYHGS